MKRLIAALVLLVLAAVAWAGVKVPSGAYNLVGVGPTGAEILDAVFDDNGATINGIAYPWVPDVENPPCGAYVATGLNADSWSFNGGVQATFTDWPPFPLPGPPVTYSYCYAPDDRQGE